MRSHFHSVLCLSEAKGADIKMVNLIHCFKKEKILAVSDGKKYNDVTVYAAA